MSAALHKICDHVDVNFGKKALFYMLWVLTTTVQNIK